MFFYAIAFIVCCKKICFKHKDRFKQRVCLRKARRIDFKNTLTIYGGNGVKTTIMLAKKVRRGNFNIGIFVESDVCKLSDSTKIEKIVSALKNRDKTFLLIAHFKT